MAEENFTGGFEFEATTGRKAMGRIRGVDGNLAIESAWDGAAPPNEAEIAEFNAAVTLMLHELGVETISSMDTFVENDPGVRKAMVEAHLSGRVGIGGN